MTSIRRQLSASLLIGFALLLGAGGTAVYVAASRSLQSAHDAALLSRASSLAALAKLEHGRITFEASKSFLADFMAGAGIDACEVRTADGAIARRLGKLPAIPGTPPPPATGGPVFSSSRLSGGQPARILVMTFTPLPEEGEEPQPPGQPLLLTVSSDRTGLENSLRQLLIILCATGAAMLVGTVILVRRAAKIALQPLEVMSRTAGEIHADSLDRRFPVDGLPVELTPIGGCLNDLVSRLEAAFSRERRFSADVAHELRTPVAELRALAEVALLTGTEPRAFVEDALHVAKNMQQIVTTLLGMARSENPQASSLQPEEFPLAALLAEAWRPQERHAASKCLAVSWEVPATLTLCSDRTLVALILENLMANSVQYSPPGSIIQITAAQSDAETILTVSNDAPALNPADLPNLCERFWRKDASRHDSGHSGLGLAISAASARLLGGRLIPELSVQGRLSMTLRLPSSKPSDREPARGSSVTSSTPAIPVSGLVASAAIGES